MKIFKIQDEYLQLGRWKIPNKTISCFLCTVQLVITVAALGQHVYSIAEFGDVLRCSYNRTIYLSEFLRADIIIFDVGLFHVLWGIEHCIPYYLDGGYLRFAWCVSQTFATVGFFVVLLKFKVPKPMFLWPMLTQQSVYGTGLFILTLSALPKLVPTMFGHIEDSKNEVEGRALLLPIFVYVCGASWNFFLVYVLWHYYWFVEEQEKMQTRTKTDSAVQQRYRQAPNRLGPRTSASNQ